MRSLNRRNLGPTTKQILRLLAAKAEEALRKEQAGIDHEALLKEISEIKPPNDYVEKRTADVAELSHLKKLARLGDYAMFYCQRLKEEAAKSSFEKLMWININETLKEENEQEEEWSRQESRLERPPKTMHEEIEQALEKIGESDCTQGYWVINFYAARNEALHSDILDDKLRGDYAKVLETVQKDIQDLVDLHQIDASVDCRHCLDMCLHFRATWFEQKSSVDGITWQPNARAKKHLKEIAQRERNLGLAHNMPEQ